MINLFYFLLLMLYAASLTYHIPGAVVAVLSMLFFLVAYKRFKKLSGNKTTALLQILCYSIPMSFRNFMGGDYGSLPIAWFYLIGAVLLIHLLSLKKPIKLSPAFAIYSLMIVLSMIFSTIPLMLTNYSFITQGMSQFLIIVFHSILVLIAVHKNGIIDVNNYAAVEKSYVAAGLFTSLGIITQYILLKNGIAIGIVEYYNFRMSVNFLFADASHATLYLATAAFLSVLLSSNKDNSTLKYNVTAILILVGAAVTSARTGLVVFFALYALYILTGQKGISKKIMAVFIGGIALYGASVLYKLVRQQSLSDILLNSSGRTDGYSAAWEMFLDNPLLGYGFGKDYIASLMGYSIPHLSFLQYMIHGGVFYALILFGIIAYAYFYAIKLKNNVSWLLLVTIVGTCLIPDIFSTRYITLLMLMVFLKSSYTTKAQTL